MQSKTNKRPADSPEPVTAGYLAKKLTRRDSRSSSSSPDSKLQPVAGSSPKAENTEASSSPRASPTHSAGALAPENTEASSSPRASPTHSAGALAPENTDQSATPVASPTHADGDLDGLPVNHDDADTFQTTAMQATPNADGTSLEESAINKEAINGDHDLNENSQGIDPETEALMVRQGAAVQLLKLRDLSHLMICEVEKHTPNQNSNDDAVLDLTTQQKQQQPADTVNENMPLDLTPENTQQVSEETENKQNGEAENVEKQTENGHTENKTENQDTSKADVPDSDELKELIKQEKKIVARKGRKSKKRKFVQGSDDEDFERPHIPDAVVDEDDGTYLSLKVPALELRL